jgi:hypothetical protein
MAPLPADSTPRYKVFYTNSGKQHVMDLRSHASPSAIGTELDAIFTAISSLLTSTVIDDMQFAASGTNVFNSVSSTFVGNTYGSGSGSDLVVASYINFIGRSSDGRRIRMAIFGTKDLAADFRFVSGENADVDSTIALLQDPASTLITIGDLRPVWKNYANAGFNAYWQRAQRP